VKAEEVGCLRLKLQPIQIIKDNNHALFYESGLEGNEEDFTRLEL
jgi:hypothetical protein